jgi:hypothetical protein
MVMRHCCERAGERTVAGIQIPDGFITGIGFMLKECMVRVKRSMACGGQYVAD